MARINLAFLTALESSVPEIAVSGWTDWRAAHQTDEWFKNIFERLAYDAAEECNTEITPFCQWRVDIDTHYQDQTIPAEWASFYIWNLQGQRADGSVRGQQPEFVAGVPSQLDKVISIDGTPKQRRIRYAFWKACLCWRWQPETGGVEPPDIGPRNRSWWYDNATYVIPIYRNWFMETTIKTFLLDVIPHWCKNMVTEDTYVYNLKPNTNYSSGIYLHAKVWGLPGNPQINRIWLKTPGTYSKILYLYLADELHSFTPIRYILIHKQYPGSFYEGTLTWNNQPALGPVQCWVTHPTGAPRWWSFDIGDAEAICIKLATEGVGVDPQQQAVAIRSLNHYWVAHRPFYLRKT